MTNYAFGIIYSIVPDLSKAVVLLCFSLHSLIVLPIFVLSSPYVQMYLVQLGRLSDHLLGKSYLLGVPYVLVSSYL